MSLLTNCLFLHLPSSPSSGLHQHVRPWRNNEGDVPLGQRCRRQGQHGHGHCACGNESLMKQLISKPLPRNFLACRLEDKWSHDGALSIFGLQHL